MNDSSHISSQTARQILEASERQVLRLKSPKLRIVDVADNLGMSHANIYRHYENRDALLDALAEKWMIESEDQARRAASLVATAQDRLSAFLIALYQAKRSRLAAGSGVVEIYLKAVKQNSDAAKRHKQSVRTALLDILSAGCDDGAFQFTPKQLPAAIDSLITASMAFLHPALVSERISQDESLRFSAIIDVFLVSFAHHPELYKG